MIYKLLAIILLLSILTLISCSSKIAQTDGPPNFYVDVSKIHDAVPKPEPLAKLGNLPSYQVFGKRYYVMRHVRNYEAIGTASWYGRKFHKRRTSSGEIYNMLGMTAAHKTLPLPTYAEVTNLRNHRTIIVKINDRGPFQGNRLIDLSYVAAKKLDMIGHGTALVKVRAIDPLTYPRTTLLAYNKPHRFKKTKVSSKIQHMAIPNKPHYANVETKYWYLQVGAFRNPSNAMKLKKRLGFLLDTKISISSSTLDKGLYRVKIGPIKDVIMADRIAAQLKQLGINPNKMNGV
mgnify:CR=1 FL=1